MQVDAKALVGGESLCSCWWLLLPRHAARNYVHVGFDLVSQLLQLYCVL